MPSYDSTRGRFRLAEQHLAVLGHRIEGEEVPAELAGPDRELRETGLTDEAGDFSILLAPLVSTLRAPAVVLHVEALGEHGTLHHGVTIGDGYVYSHESWPGSEESEYVRLEPNMLVWTDSPGSRRHSGARGSPGSLRWPPSPSSSRGCGPAGG